MADPLHPQLPAHVLARRAELPATPEAVVLEGERLRLRPVEPADLAELHAISNGTPVNRLGRTVDAYDSDMAIWRFMPIGPFADLAAFSAFVADLTSWPDSATWVVEDRATGELVGSLSFLANRPLDLKVEIGAVWYTPAAQGTGANTEATLLLLHHAFALGYRRVEWKTHSGNQRSRAAALRLGFTFEGVQEAHAIQKGARRDTAWFRLLAEEWPLLQPQ